jgi:pimeloyl-ACP methyl ester carboxylesterase
LIGFCWGGNQALLAAWYDSRAATHPSISSHIAARLRPVSPVGHFEAGVIAFSPVLRFEDIIESLETRHTAWRNPVLAHLQNTVYERMKFKGHPNPCGSLYQLIVSEVARSDLAYPRAVDDGLDFLRLMPHRGQPDGDKLAECRMPVLIVQSANDPLSPAQDLADFVARVDNHNVAGIILPGGGHVGFAAYARSYYFSLIGNFFDAQNAPKARDIPRLAKSSKSDPA